MTLCGYRAGERLWAFNRMGSARREISRVTGLRFWKLLGAGHGGGFGLRPDFSRYGLLAVWEDAEAADRFFADSSVMASYRRHAEEIWSLRLLPVYALGTWSGVNPFLPVAAPPPPRRELVRRRTLRPLRANQVGRQMARTRSARKSALIRFQVSGSRCQVLGARFQVIALA